MITLLNRPNPLLNLRPGFTGTARLVLAELRSDKVVRDAWKQAERIAEEPLHSRRSLRPALIRPAYRVIRELGPVRPVADAADLPETVFEYRGQPAHFVHLPIYFRPPFRETPENEERNAAWRFGSFMWMREHVSLGQAIQLVRVIGVRDVYGEVMRATVDKARIATHYAKKVWEDFLDDFGTLPTQREAEKADNLVWMNEFLEEATHAERPLTIARGLSLMRA